MTPKALSSTSRAELRAMNWFTLTHGIGLLLFALLIAALLWYLNRAGVEQQRQTLYRDIEWAQQSIRLQLRDNQDEIVAATSDWALSDQIEESDTRSRARDFLATNQYVTYLARVGADRKVVWAMPGRGVYSVMLNRAPGSQIDDSPGYGAFHEGRDTRRPVFTDPFLGQDNETIVEMHTPIIREGAYLGSIIVGYSLGRLLTITLSENIRARYHLQIADQGGNALVASSPRRIHEANLGYELPLDPPGHGVRLRAYAFDTAPKLVERSLLVAVIGLSIGSVASMLLLWRHARRRIAAEAERDRLFELSDDLMCTFDHAGCFLRANPAFVQAFGDAAATSTLFDLAHPDDQSMLRALLGGSGKGVNSPSALSFEARFAQHEQWRWLHWSARSDPLQPERTWYAVAHDVTERRSAESALAAETSFRQAMEDSMLTGMRTFDMQGCITYVNRAFCEMLGFTADELIGVSAPYPYWPQEDLAAHELHLQMVLNGHAPASGFEVKVQRKDGSTFFSRMYVSPLVGRDGRQSGWMTSITDITEPKRIREELAAAHERFTTVLDELDAAIWVVPVNGGSGATPVAPPGPANDSADRDAERADGDAPLFTNRMFRHLFGSADDVGPLLKATEDAATGWLPREVLLPRSGKWFEVRSRQIRWVDGRPVRMIVATDITRRHEVEEQHRQQDEKLQRTARLVTMGEMASSLAHELNQPLTAIANYCMGLSARIRTRVDAGKPLDANEMLQMLAKTAAQAERAGMVIRRIRGFVKRSEPERTRCEVHSIVADAIGLAEIDAQRLGKRVEVRLEPDLPSLNADPILIEQVMLNLIKNGIEAMRSTPHRTLRVTVRLQGENVEFAVADTGPGLSPEANARLFEPFFTTKAEGMGMGLNICRSIIESHQGRLWAETNEWGGCTFRFTLPIHAAGAMPVAA